MKYISVFILFLIATHSNATICREDCSDQDYDIIAVIKITGVNEQYKRAFDAKIETLQFFANNYDVEASPEKIIIISNIIGTGEALKTNEPESNQPDLAEGERRFEAVRMSSGGMLALPKSFRFEVGDSIHFFGREVSQNIYNSPPCSCSTPLNQEPLITSGSSDGTAQSAAP